LTLEWAFRKGRMLQASERPLRASGSGKKAACGVSGSTDPAARESGQSGSRPAERPALQPAVLSAVHAGGEQGWVKGCSKDVEAEKVT
jgi:hypothetical protein